MNQREFLTRRIAQIAAMRPTSQAGAKAQEAAIQELWRELPKADSKVVGYITPQEPYGQALGA